MEIGIGLNKSGSECLEVRHMSDIKIANLRDDAVIATRPKRGRPATRPSPSNRDQSPEENLVTNASDTSQLSTNVNNDGTDQAAQSPNLSNSNVGGNSSKPVRSTRNSAPNYVDSLIAAIDFSKPPPPYSPAGNSNVISSRSWSASKEEIAALNRQIGA